MLYGDVQRFQEEQQSVEVMDFAWALKHHRKNGKKRK